MLKEGNIIGDYKLEIKIGVGANGSVFRVLNIKTKEIKALKALLLQGETSLSSDLQIGMKLSRSCDFLVRYENVFIAGDFQCIVMEYFEQGDLQKYFNSGYKLNENDVCHLIYQISSAISFLHDHNITHRDLKLENIFVTKDGNFKLGDFGISRIASTKMTGGVGTEGYQAPEILDGQIYGTPADIYALGIVIYQVMSGGKYPFVNAQGMYSMAKALSGQDIPLESGIWTESLKELGKCLFALKPETRPSAKQIMSHPVVVKGEECWKREKEGEVEMNKLKEKIKQLEKENKEIQIKNQEFEKENKEIKEKNKQLEKENKEFEKENKEIKEKIKQLEKENEKLNEKIKQTESKEKGQEKEINKPKENIEQMKKDSSSSSSSSPSPFYSDTSSPLSHLLLPNPHGHFTLEGREARFSCRKDGGYRSLVFREGISDGVLEVKIKYSGDVTYFGVISSSRVDKCLESGIGDSSCGGASFCFNSAYSWFCCGGSSSAFFKKGEDEYGVSSSAVVTGVLDMRDGKHTLHFLVEEELLPHTYVNIPQEKMHIGISTGYDVIVTLVCLSLYSSPPPMPFTRCIAYNYDGSNILNSYNNRDKLKYEDGSVIPNVNEYFK